MAKIDKNTSQVLNILRLPLAFLIVAGHANTLMFPLTKEGVPIVYDYTVIQYPIHLLSQILFAPAVPLFFMISGFLFFVGLEQYDRCAYKQKMLRRARTLLLPYVVWNLIYMLPMIAANVVKHKGYDVWCFLESLWICPDQIERIARMEMATPADPPLWFIRDLMVCMVLSPLVWFIIRRKWFCVPTMAVLFIPWVFGMGVQYPFPGLSMPSLLFFSLGAVAAYYKIDLRKMSDGSRTLVGMMCLYAVLLVVELVMVDYHISFDGINVSVNIRQDPLLHGFLTFTGCFAFLSVAYWLVKTYAVERQNWGGAFSVFAVHWLLLNITSKLIGFFCPAEISQMEGFMLYLLLVVIGFGGGLAVNYVITKNRYLLNVFSGGRS